MKSVRLVLLFLLAILCVISAAKPAKQLRFGVDLFLGSKQMVLRSRLGDNMTNVTMAYLQKNGFDLSTTHETVLINMQDAAGARCDACKTMVEHIGTHFREVSRQGRPKLDAAGLSEMTSKVCGSKQFSEYNGRVKLLCKQQLGLNVGPIVRAWEGVGLEARNIPGQKTKVCTEMLLECPARRQNPSVTKCQACMESFMTLEYLIRRDSPTIKFSNPMAVTKKNKKVADGFGSSRHLEARMEEVCQELHLHFTGTALEAIQEVCDEIVSEHGPQVKSAFSVMGRGQDFEMPLQSICVTTAEACTQQDFDDHYPHLENFHANITHAYKPRVGNWKVPSNTSKADEL